MPKQVQLSKRELAAKRAIRASREDYDAHRDTASEREIARLTGWRSQRRWEET